MPKQQSRFVTKEETVQISLRLLPSELHAIRLQADAWNASTNETIRRLISMGQFHLAEHAGTSPD